jgi:hypothetical protein
VARIFTKRFSIRTSKDLRYRAEDEPNYGPREGESSMSAIDDKYAALGGASGFLDAPQGPELITPNG